MTPSPNNKIATKRLNDESLAVLLDEVIAMSRAGRSLVPGFVDLGASDALGAVGRAARQVRKRIEQGHPASDAIADLSSKYGRAIRVAMDVMSRTGSTEAIDETVQMIRDANEHRRQIRYAAIYPILSAAIAATVLFFVMPFILTSISKSEPIQGAFAPSVTEINQTFQQNFFLAATATVVTTGLFAAGLYGCLTRSIRAIDVQRDHATLCRWLAIQIHEGVDTSQAIAASVAVVGPRFEESWSRVLESVRGGGQTAASLMMPALTPDPVQTCVVDMVAGTRAQQSIVWDLRQLAALYEQQSRRYRSWWVDALPRWVTSLFMIGIIVLLLRTMLVPLLEAAQEALV